MVGRSGDPLLPGPPDRRMHAPIARLPFLPRTHARPYFARCLGLREPSALTSRADLGRRRVTTRRVRAPGSVGVTGHGIATVAQYVTSSTVMAYSPGPSISASIAS